MPLWMSFVSETAALKTAGSSQTEGLPQTENRRTSGWDHETRAECYRSPLCWSQWTTAAAAAGWCDCTEQSSFQWNTASVLCPVSSVQDLCWRKPKDTRSVNITQTCIQCNIQHMVLVRAVLHLTSVCSLTPSDAQLPNLEQITYSHHTL